MTITILLVKPVARGANRRLTANEVKHIRALRTNVRPTTGPAWMIERNDDGFLSLRYRQANGEGATWAVETMRSETFSALRDA